jgi:two-component system LytT family response regulator
MPIKELEGLLEEKGFFRTHKSYLVNTHQVKKISLKENGLIILTNNSEIPLSQRKRQLFIKLMESVSNKF